jgi:predicted transcriptional regulator
MSTRGATRNGSAALSQSDVHDVLRNERRRLVLEQLREGPESVRDLSEYIASVESGESPPPRNVRQSVYVSLHQTHLPKLDDLGIVVYDEDDKEVTLAEHAEAVTVFLEPEPEPEPEPPWALVQAGVAGVGLLFALGGLAGLPVVSAVGPVVCVLALAAVGGLATYQVVEDGDGETG